MTEGVGLAGGRSLAGCSTVLIQSPHLHISQNLTLLPFPNCVHKSPNKVSPLKSFGRGEVQEFSAWVLLCVAIFIAPCLGRTQRSPGDWSQGLCFLHLQNQVIAYLTECLRSRYTEEIGLRELQEPSPADHRDETLGIIFVTGRGNGPLSPHSGPYLAYRSVLGIHSQPHERAEHQSELFATSTEVLQRHFRLWLPCARSLRDDGRGGALWGPRRSAFSSPWVITQGPHHAVCQSPGPFALRT